jgi:hypothetical protein
MAVTHILFKQKPYYSYFIHILLKLFMNNLNNTRDITRDRASLVR